MDLKNPPTLSKIVTNFFTGFGSGLVGTAVFGIIILLSWSIVGDTLSPTDIVKNEFGVQINNVQTHPLFLHFITLAIFLGILVGNLAFVFLSATSDARYTNKTTLITHVFFSNLVLLVFMLAGYVTFSNLFAAPGVAAAAIIHMILSVLFSFFTLEFVNFSRHLFVSLYGILVGIILFLIAGAVFLAGNASLLAFLSLPLLMGFVLMGNSVIQAVYGWMYANYGIDALNIETRFGEDYGQK